MKRSKVTLSQTKHVAGLSNLELDQREISQFQDQLDSVLDYVSQIQQLDLSKVKETHQVTDLTNIFREDTIQTDRILSQELALSNAKKTYNGYFVVPALIEK